MPAEALDFREFKKQLEILRGVVAHLICEEEFDITRPIFYAVLTSPAIDQRGVESLRAYFFNFARSLLKMEDGGKLKDFPGFSEQCKENGHEHSDTIKDADFAECLTVTSFALYFLGQPFNQPWERVRQMVRSSIGGLPNGACVAKAIGDVVRSARLAGVRARKSMVTGRAATGLPQNVSPSDPAYGPLLIHSHMPLILHKSFVKTGDAIGCVPESAHVLGHCYELLQIMLYAHEGLPFRYFVPTPIFKAKLSSDGPTPEKAWNDALDWMCKRVFPGEFDQQFIVLTSTETFRPVFINGSAGVITSLRPPEGTKGYVPAPLPGTFLREARLNLFRQNLMQIPVDKKTNLYSLARKADTREEAFRDLFPLDVRSAVR